MALLLKHPVNDKLIISYNIHMLLTWIMMNDNLSLSLTCKVDVPVPDIIVRDICGFHKKAEM